MEIKNTNNVVFDGVKILVYGQAGATKTRNILSLPSPFIVSVEGGLLSIADSNINYVEVKNMNDLREVHKWFTQSAEAKQYKSIAIDSITELSELVLNVEKKNNKDGRAAYGEMNEKMAVVIRSFRDLRGIHVYMTAKLEKTQDEMGRVLYSPSMPGKTLTQELPYFFDEVFALRVEKDADGDIKRGFLCDSDGLWLAKDRSGKLRQWEDANIGKVIDKIIGNKLEK